MNVGQAHHGSLVRTWLRRRGYWEEGASDSGQEMLADDGHSLFGVSLSELK